MSRLRFWFVLSLLSAAMTALSVYIFSNHSSPTNLLNSISPFSGSPAYTFNHLGIFLGISGTMLWIAKSSPVSDKLAVILFGIGFISIFYVYRFDPIDVGPSSYLGMILWPIGVASFCFAVQPWLKKRLCKTMKDDQAFLYTKQYLYFTFLFLFLGAATGDALNLNSIILPITIDFDIYRIDLAYHGIAQWVYTHFEQFPIILQTIIYVAYDLLSIILLFSVALVMRDRRAEQLNIFRTLVVPFLLAFALYCFMPVAGPVYVFGYDYPWKDISWITQETAGQMHAVHPSPRNGMPSMHFSGAMLVALVMMCLRNKIFFYIACLFVLLTAIATLGLGEHYFVDLVAAAPFCLALGTALLNPPGWIFYQRRIWWLCTLSASLWGIMFISDSLRAFLVHNLWFVQIFSLCSIILAAICFVEFKKVVWRLPVPVNTEQTDSTLKVTSDKTSKLSVRWVYGLFVCSGFAGLLYEVVFAKSLGITFGGTSLAAYTVMATYMGGMALGAWIGGILADRIQSPLKWYAIFEATIGIYALATPMLFELVEHFYVYLAIDIRPDATILTFYRVTLGMVVLGIPTLLMGTTLPIMFKFLRNYLPDTGRIISRLYTANIMGAALGALTGAYFVLPNLGILSSTRLAALLSLMIALYTLDRLKNNFIHKNKINPAKDNNHTVPISPHLGITALLVVTIGGIVTLALEIANMHMLAIIAGNSVYAFGLMLATFLLGLGLGSIFYEKLCKKLSDPLIATIAQLGIFFTIIISAFQWDGLTDYFAGFEWMQLYHHMNFAAREVIRASVCAIIMIPSAFFIGMGYPATMAMSSTWLNQRRKGEAVGIGLASLCNTFGNIAGVLLAGFLLLNWLGSNRFLFTLALMSLALSILMLIAGRNAWMQAFKGRTKKLYATGTLTFIAIALAIFIYPSRWNLDVLTTGANVYFQSHYRGEVIAAKESIEGGLTTVNKDPKIGTLTLLTNGKFQGNNAGEIEAQRGFALVPLLHMPNRDNALVIGYGTGNSAHILHEQGFTHLDIIELSKDIVDMADQYFDKINHFVSQKDNVNMYYTDGRNFLLTHNKKYDLISMEVTSIWFAGAANLYNQEFYQLAKMRLKDTGVLQQWVQLHHMQPIDLIYVLNTLHREFRYVRLYMIGGQGILVATNSEVMSKNLYHLNGKAVEDMSALTKEEKEMLTGILLEPEDMDYISGKMLFPQLFVSSDNNLYLEYSTPKGNALSYDSASANLEMLKRFREERLHLSEK